MKIEWQRYADHAYCFHYLPKKSRKEFMDHQLEFVDLLNNPIFEYKFATDNMMYDAFLKDPDIKKVDRVNLSIYTGFFKSTIDQYLCLKEAYDRGFESIFLFEDDLAFYDNKTMIVDVLENRPFDADLCLYDWWPAPQSVEEVRKRSLLDKYVQFGSVDEEPRIYLYASSFMWISHAMIKHLIDKYETEFCESDSIYNNTTDDTMIRYYSNPHLGRQMQFSEHNSPVNMDFIYRDRVPGFDMSMYNFVHAQPKSQSFETELMFI